MLPPALSPYTIGLLATFTGCVLLPLWLGLRRLTQARALADMPLSRVRSAAQGQVELLGCARWMPGPPIYSPVSHTPCVWWRYRVHRREDRRDEFVAGGVSDDLFFVGDSTGDCIVDPVGAEVEPSVTRRWRGQSPTGARLPSSNWDAFFTSGPYQYSEQFIRTDALLIARGWFRTQAATQDADDSREVSALLADWKRDRHTLLQRFDADRNGLIDPQEWESARAAALEEVRAQHAGQSTQADLNVLGKPPDGGEFVLSAMPRPQLIARYIWQGWTLLVIAMLAGIADCLLLSLLGHA